jgi:hypothetical protein
MVFGAFKIDIDNHSETIFKNFIYANSHKGGYNATFLNKDRTSYGVIENIVYDLAQHNISHLKKKYNEDINVSFFTKCYKVPDDDTHMHTDCDDLDFFVNDKETMRPIISSITFLTKSDHPFMITNLTTNDIYDINNNNNIDINKDVGSLVYYPDKYDHIIFEGGKYFHGEIPMSSSKLPFSNTQLECKDNLCKERLLLVILLWKKTDIPCAPYYTDENMAYKVIDNDLYTVKKTGLLNDYIHDIMKGKRNILNEQDSTNIEKYKLELSNKKLNIINYIDEALCYKFYANIINRRRHNLYNLNNVNDYDVLNKKTNNKNEVSLQELNNIFFLSNTDTNINNLFNIITDVDNSYLLNYNIFEQSRYNYITDILWKNKKIYDSYPVYKMHNIDLQIEDNNLNDCIDDYISNREYIFGNKQFLLDTKKKHFSPVEKLVYEIAENTLSSANILFDNNIGIEFWIKTERDDSSITFHLDSTDSGRVLGYNLYPFLSNIFYLNDDYANNYTVVSNLTMQDLKYRRSTDCSISFILPKKNKLLTLFGGKHYHGNIKANNSTRRLLIINYWYKLPLQYYNYYNYYKNKYNTQLYTKTQPVSTINVSRNYNNIYLDSDTLEVIGKKMLDTHDALDNYVDLIKKIDNTYDATTFSVNNNNRTQLQSVKFSLDIVNNNYIDDEFDRLNNEDTSCEIKNTQDAVVNVKYSEISINPTLISKDKFDIYNHYIPYKILDVITAYIKLLDSNYNIVNNENNECLELDFTTDFDENMQKYIFKFLLLGVLDNMKTKTIDIQSIKIRKDVKYNQHITCKHIYIPICDDFKITVDNHVLNIIKSGFIDIKDDTDVSINCNDLILCMEYI